MKKTVIKYGFYGLLLSATLFLMGLVLGKNIDMSVQQIIGYATMVASLCFVFIGIKHYRDKVNNGVVSFGKALLIGILISAITGIGIAIVDYIYTTFINPDFFTDYAEAMRAEGYTGEIPEWSSSFAAFFMFMNVVVIGFIISLISALILQRKN